MTTLRRVLILDQNYPSESNLYADVFVHVRAKEYARRAEVVVASTPNAGSHWRYEGIEVRAFADTERLAAFIDEYRPDVIAAHFIEGPIVDLLLRTRFPFVVWVHGYEGMAFYRRLFELESAPALLRKAVSSSRRLLHLRKLLLQTKRTGRGSFVVPSRWMLQAVQTDALLRVERIHVVPNPIDGELFRYVPKSEQLRNRVLLLRPFSSRKYATDIAADAIVRLSDRPAFASFHFDVYGRGPLFAETAGLLARFPNVALHEQFLPQKELPALHARHGVILCPTRQDTHGVTMCEGMSSGLVPITSRNSAIPEFVTDRVSGLLTRSSQEVADRMLELHEDPALFARLSAGAAREVRARCGLPGVIARELEILEQAAASQSPPS